MKGNSFGNRALTSLFYLQAQQALEKAEKHKKELEEELRLCNMFISTMKDNIDEIGSHLPDSTKKKIHDIYKRVINDDGRESYQDSSAVTCDVERILSTARNLLDKKAR